MDEDSINFFAWANLHKELLLRLYTQRLQLEIKSKSSVQSVDSAFGYEHWRKVHLTALQDSVIQNLQSLDCSGQPESEIRQKAAELARHFFRELDDRVPETDSSDPTETD